MTRLLVAILCGHDGRRGCLYHVCVDEAYRMRMESEKQWLYLQWKH